MSGDARSAARGAWVLPGFVGLLGLVVAGEGIRLPLTQQYVGLGPGFVVLVVGLALLILAGVLVWQIRSGVAFEPEEAEGTDVSAPPSLTRLGWAAAGVGSPVVLIGLLGFPLAGGIAYACVTRAFGSARPLVDLAIGLALSGATWWAFTRLGVQLGPFHPF